MHVVFGLLGKVQIHHIVHVGHIDAAGEHVGGHQDVAAAGRECLERALALVLTAVGMDGLAFEARSAQLAHAVVHAMAGAREHDDAGAALFFQQRDKEVVLLALGHAHDVLVYRVGGFALMGDFHEDGVVQKVLHVALDAVVDRGAEEKRLALFGALDHNALHVGQKAHVEHAVGFVEHERFDLAQVGGILLDQVDQTTGRGDEDVGALGERVDLRAVGYAADDLAHLVVGFLGDRGADLFDLHGELAGGGHHEHERALPMAGVPQLVHGRQAERGGFPGAGFGCGDDVAPFEHGGNGLLLHGGGVEISKVAHGGQSELGKAELIEMFGHRGKSLMKTNIRCGIWTCTQRRFPHKAIV